jgi:uncharacterized membrane protein
LLKAIATRLRRYIVAGLLIWFPLGATILVFTLLLDISNRVLVLVPQRYRPEELLGFDIPGLGLALAIIVLLSTGIAGAGFLGRRLVGLYESVLNRIPLVRSVYGAVKHFAEMVFSDSGTSFKKVLLIEYPRHGLYSIAFQTSDQPAEVQHRTGEEIVTVFLPTTPNPTSGFMLFVPRKDTIELEMAVDDALKMIISLGVVVPKWHPLHPEHVDRELARPQTRS